jgi:hypothetical protein
MTAPPGFYDDGSGQQRWWDGTAWKQYNTVGDDRKRKPASVPQRRWLALHWFAAAWAAYFFLAIPFFPAESPGEFNVLFAGGAGAVACLAGTLITHSLYRARLSDAEFIRATTTTRVVAGTWLFCVGVIGASVFVELDELAVIGETTLVALLGPASILAIIGPALSEYVSARHPPGSVGPPT